MAVTSPLPVAVIGAGRMGRLHARTYAGMPQVELVGVCDADPTAARRVAGEFACQAFTSVDELVGRVQAVTVAVPTCFHLAAAEPFLRAGIACLIEKPLAPDTATAARIADLAREHHALVQVGHIERFNPAIVALRKLKLTPQFIETRRISPLTFRSIDVGVVLDMMIHDIDIVLMLADSPVETVAASGVRVVGSAEDACTAWVRFASGAVANLTASRLALTTERKLRMFSAEGYASVDYQKRTGILARRDQNVAGIQDAVGRLRRGEVADPSSLKYEDLVHFSPLAIAPADSLGSELGAFVNAVVSGTPSPVPAEAGLAAVRLAEQIVAAASH